MRICLFTVALLASFGIEVSTAAEKNDGSLDSIAWATSTSAAQTCPLLLTARVVHNAAGYVLSFTLKNMAGRPLTFNRHDLPWGNIDSIQTAAVTTQGQLVLGAYPIEDDFGLDRVTIRPNEMLTGDYALSHRWNDMSTPPTGFPRDTTVVLMWAYKVRAEQFPAEQWPICTGVTSFKVSR
jgi:hypothetical protein